MKIIITKLLVFAVVFSKDLVDSVKIKEVRIEGVKSKKVKEYLLSLIKYKKNEYIDPFNINLIEVELEKNPNILKVDGEVVDGILTLNIKAQQEIIGIEVKYSKDLFNDALSHLEALEKNIEKQEKNKKLPKEKLLKLEKEMKEIKIIKERIESFDGKIEEFEKKIKEKEEVLSKKEIETLSKLFLNEFKKYSMNQDLLVTKKIKGDYVVMKYYDSKDLKIKKIDIKSDLTEELLSQVSNLNLNNEKYKYVNELYFSDVGNYKSSKMRGDMIKIQDFLLKNGFVSPSIKMKNKINYDKKEIEIEILIKKGDRFSLKNIELSFYEQEHGNQKKEILEIIQFYKEKEFQKKYYDKISIIELCKDIENQYKNNGYKNPSIELKEEKDKNFLISKIKVKAGKKYKISKINIKGLEKTEKSVLEKQLLVSKGVDYSQKYISKSKIKLQRLGFFKEVKIKEEEEGSNVDLLIEVEEDKTGIISGSLGYNSIDKVLYGFNLEERNFLGKGYSIGVNSEKSQNKFNLTFKFTNPYITEDIGSSTKLSYDFKEYDLFETEGKFLEQSFFKYLSDELTIGSGVVLGQKEEKIEEEEGNIKELKEDKYGILMFASYNSTNNYNFPTEGIKASISLKDYGKLGGEVKYSRLSSALKNYKSFEGVLEDNTFTLKSSISSIITKDNGYIPVSEKLYMGGEIRGFNPYSIKPTGSLVGGNSKIIGSFDLVTDFKYLNRSKVGLFYDYGVVADDISMKNKEFRHSGGLSFYWISPVGPLSVSYSLPLNGEEIEQSKFEFNLGKSF